MKYRKRPIEVEALQIHGNVSEIKEFIGENGDAYIEDAAWKVGKGQPHTVVTIHTLEGDMRATDGDYIIKGVKGEFYPCHKDIFEETYELAESEESDDIEALLEHLWNATEEDHRKYSEVEASSSNFIQLKQDVLNNKQLWRKLREIEDEDSD